MSKCTVCKGTGLTPFRPGEFMDLEFIPACSHCEGTGKEPITVEAHFTDEEREKPTPLWTAIVFAIVALGIAFGLLYIVMH